MLQAYRLSGQFLDPLLGHRPLRLITCMVFALLSCGVLSAEGPEFREGSTIVQTLTFEDIDKRSGTFEFPSGEQTWERILMHYTLKCDELTTADRFPCGEWDYITNTEIIDSTGVLDSTEFSQANFTVDGRARDEFSYTNTPSYLLRQIPYTRVAGTFAGSYSTALDFQTEDVVTLAGNGTTTRNVYQFSKDELESYGVQAGPISALKLQALTPNSTIHVRVRMRSASVAPDLSTLEDGWQLVYDSPVELGSSAANELLLIQAFDWDGNSGIDVEISSEDFENSNRVILGGLAGGEIQGLQAAPSKHVWFRGDDWLEVPSEAFANLNDGVTIMLWQYGDPAIQPQNNYTFEGRDAEGRRVINVHLPWNNGQVYWDAGNAGTGNYDRIQKEANAADFEGQWNHWAFTKNLSSGQMNIYLNGELWHSGSGMTRFFSEITEFRIGAAVNGGGNYDGGIDEFSVFDAELSPSVISTIMNMRANLNGEFQDNLRAYYQFNEGNGMADASGNGYDAVPFGWPQLLAPRAQDLRWGMTQSSRRPNIQFGSGSSNVTTTQDIRLIREANDRVTLRRFANPYGPTQVPLDAPDYPNIPVGTEFVFEAGIYTYTYDADGNKVDSSLVETETTLTRENLLYYSPIVRYEIGRYITPYGINLDLGPEGVTWVYDVTDFAPFLKDYVWLRAHNRQELIDLKFEFIPGTPARDVISVNNLHDANRSYQAVADDEVFQAKTLVPREDGEMWKLRTIISGHGFGGPTQCAEFCERDFNYRVNGDIAFEWLVWKECGAAPIYPQGGTWLIDRAGWCPGEIVDLAEHDLTPFMLSGEPISLDFGVEHYSLYGVAEGNWDVSSQLVTYGAPNRQVDAALEQIIAPSDWELNSRFNPICGQPIIRIMNSGEQNLTSVDIEYGVRGGNKATYTWTGSLEFMESEVVALPLFDWGTWEGENIFEVSLSNPNGGADEYMNNNSHFSRFETAPLFAPEFEINLRTNNQAAQQYAWTLRKIDGELVDQGSNLESNRTYVEEYVLEEGCYEFELTNALGYGLDFWFLRDQLGTGSLQFTSLGNRIWAFEPDFGNFTRLQFEIGEVRGIKVSEDTLRYGKVAAGGRSELTLEVTPANDQGIVVSEVDIAGIGNRFELVSVSPSLDNGDVALSFGEVMTITVAFTPSNDSPAAGSLRISSNDERSPVKRIRLVGNQVVTSVGDPTLETAVLADLRVDPNPAQSAATVAFSLNSPFAVATRVSIVNAMGVEVMVLDDGLRDFGEHSLPLNTEGLANGAYFVVLRAGASTFTSALVIAR